MFGNILNNTQIRKLRDAKQIIIRPFRPDRLKLAHYALRPIGLLRPGQVNAKGLREHHPIHDFLSKPDYVFEPNEYAIVEIEEFIFMESGFVGHFLPSSSLIERGFGLTAGKLDAGYGKVRFHKYELLDFNYRILVRFKNVI